MRQKQTKPPLQAIQPFKINDARGKTKSVDENHSRLGDTGKTILRRMVNISILPPPALKPLNSDADRCYPRLSRQRQACFALNQFTKQRTKFTLSRLLGAAPIWQRQRSVLFPSPSLLYIVIIL